MSIQSTVSPDETVRDHPDTEIVAKHTPTPWKVDGAMIRANGLYVAELSSPLGGDVRAANAAFIVKAVNSHDALVASLREMIEVYWGEGDGHEPPPSCIQRAQGALS